MKFSINDLFSKFLFFFSKVLLLIKVTIDSFFVLPYKWTQNKESGFIRSGHCSREVYPELCQTSKMKCFVKIVNGFQPFNAFAKRSILDVLENSQYAYCSTNFDTQVAFLQFSKSICLFKINSS